MAKMRVLRYAAQSYPMYESMHSDHIKQKRAIELSLRIFMRSPAFSVEEVECSVDLEL